VYDGGTRALNFDKEIKGSTWVCASVTKQCNFVLV